MPINLGTGSIGSIRLGTKQVTAVYVGTKQVFPATTPGPGPGPAPTGTTWTVDLDNPDDTDGFWQDPTDGNAQISWFYRAGNRPSLDTRLVVGGAASFLSDFTIDIEPSNTDMKIDLRSSQSGSGDSADLISNWENRSDAITLALSGVIDGLIVSGTLTLPGPAHADWNRVKDTSADYSVSVNPGSTLYNSISAFFNSAWNNRRASNFKIVATFRWS